MDKRQERMLEEVLKLPGNNCRAIAPRWASVNLGVFLCVGCASVHRKMGTHTSRVKSVTLDTWTREQISTMRSIGNTASNQKYNPDERAHPPPTNAHSDERDSEMEKHIRRKYEQKAFMDGARGASGPAPTSLNRARDKAAVTSGVGAGANPWLGRDNRRNPELNDVVVPTTKAEVKEKALPGLPEGGSRRGSATGQPLAPPRLRPSPTPSRSSSIQNLVKAGGVVGPSNPGSQLIDINGASSSTLPLQLASRSGTQFQGYSASGNAQSSSQLGMSAFATSPMSQQTLSPASMSSGNNYFSQPTQQQQFGSFGQSPSSFPQLQQQQQHQQPSMLNIPSHPMVHQQFSTSPGGTFQMQSMNPFNGSAGGTIPGEMMGYSPGGMYGGQGFAQGPSQMQVQMGMGTGMGTGVQGQYQFQAQGQAQAPQWSMQGMQMQSGMNDGWQGQQSYHG